MTHLILGIDEVGRGPIAGPLVVGACVLPESSSDDQVQPDLTTSHQAQRNESTDDPVGDQAWQNDLTDSKRLTEKRREALDPIIRERALAFGLGWVPAEELDRLRLPDSLRVATFRAVQNLCDNFSDVHFDEIIIDGITNFLEGTPYEQQVTTVIKADLKIKAVSAASIIAKVARDRYMSDTAAQEYPGYEFAKHKGYGTKLHWQCLSELGPCPEHRRLIARIAKTYGASRPPAQPTSATRNVPQNDRALSCLHLDLGSTAHIQAGNRAEAQIAAHLEANGHKILARNYRRPRCEIDIISATSEHIYFTEVKYRSSELSGSPAEAVTPAKRQHLLTGAQTFMQELSTRLARPLENLPSPIFAVGTVGADGELDWFTLDSGDCPDGLDC